MLQILIQSNTQNIDSVQYLEYIDSIQYLEYYKFNPIPRSFIQCNTWNIDSIQT